MQSLPDGYVLRLIESGDYDKDLFGLLSQLTSAPQISQDDFNEIIRSPHSEFIIVEYLPASKIVATVRINYERKLIRGGAKVCHLEDFVVDENHRCKGLGKILIDHVKKRAQEAKCYKLIGICSDEMVPFYQKTGFACNHRVFSQYF